MANDKQPTELELALVLIHENYAPCEPEEANFHLTTADFIRMVQDHIGSVGHKVMNEHLVNMGYKTTFIDNQIVYAIRANTL